MLEHGLSACTEGSSTSFRDWIIRMNHALSHLYSMIPSVDLADYGVYLGLKIRVSHFAVLIVILSCFDICKYS